LLLQAGALIIVWSMKSRARKIVTLFGTRSEVIKLAPVIHQLETDNGCFRTINILSAQYTESLYPLVRLFDIRIDYDLKLAEPNQTSHQVCARVLTSLEPLLKCEKPDLLLVQGDATIAMAGALAGFYHRIPVGHIEAGLRSGDVYSPYPEEMNRRLITRLATYHFAATPHNRATLLAEGVRENSVFVTGSPVVDALRMIIKRGRITPVMRELFKATEGLKRLILTTHRQENFGALMASNLRVIRNFIERHPDVALISPVHPNPAVVQPAMAILSDHPRIYLLPPLDYQDFVGLLSRAWLIVSDSGRVQEEAPTLGKPLLVLQQNTERPEAIEAGVARLVGGTSRRLATMLEDVYTDGMWSKYVGRVDNPFGRGDSGQRIVRALAEVLEVAGTS
jgi:UDP-N-acetylglucosamine 2-epimerase (non-hydrolysing)